MSRRVWPIDPRTYPAENSMSLERVIADMRAAEHLGIPFQVRTTYRQGFRNGGNVNKADIYEYRVEFGLYEKEEEKKDG